MNLTRQLLAFSRRQTIEPQVLNLNETIGSMLKMLRRLIGEGIDLTWQPDSELWPVCIDPAQVDQILANLCVNARDAIDGVGTITIETANARLDDAYCREHTYCEPGRYVEIVVSDTGCGMEQETQSSIFEPFFTTKEPGKGTGQDGLSFLRDIKETDPDLPVIVMTAYASVGSASEPSRPGRPATWKNRSRPKRSFWKSTRPARKKGPKNRARRLPARLLPLNRRV